MKRYLLPIIVSAVSLVVMTVVTYAYFTATIDPSGETTASIRTATIGTVTFLTTSPTTNLTNVYPGWEGTGSTTVYFNTNSDDDVAYHCTVQLENDSYATNVYVQTLSGGDAQVPTETALTSEGVTISQGTLEHQNNIASGSHGTEHVVTYKIIFKEIGQAQNTDQGRTINTYTTCVVDQQAGSALNQLSGVMYDANGTPIANQAMVIYSEPTYFTTGANGEYSVTVESGTHTLYFVPGMSMADLRSAGDTIKTNASAKSVSINTETMTSGDIIVSSLTSHVVSIICHHCTTDVRTADVMDGSSISVSITPTSGYSLSNISYTHMTGGSDASYNSGTLSIYNVTSDTSYFIAAGDPSSTSVLYFKYNPSLFCNSSNSNQYITPVMPDSCNTSQDCYAGDGGLYNLTAGNGNEYNVFYKFKYNSSNPYENDACIYYGGQYLCLSSDYWYYDAQTTLEKLKYQMDLIFPNVTCTIANDNLSVTCKINNSSNYYCKVYGGDNPRTSCSIRLSQNSGGGFSYAYPDVAAKPSSIFCYNPF